MFPYYFCLTIEGSGSGFISLTNGSGYGGPKNKWIPRIRIQIQIRICNTGSDPRERAGGRGYLMSSDLRGECAAILEESLTAAKKGVEGAEEDILILVYL
jgi:hypothetical protein